MSKTNEDFFKDWQKTCIFLTRRCQLSCRGCNVINFQSEYEMTTNEWKEAFDIMDSYDVGFVPIFGGEPTLRDDLPKLVEYLNSIDMPHTVITNSIRLLEDDEYYDRLIDSNPWGISCSVNSVTDLKDTEYSDEVKTKKGVQLLQKLIDDGYDGDLVANMAMTAENLDEIPKMIVWATERGIYSILTGFHVSEPHEAMFYWYRGPRTEENENLIITKDDRERLKALKDWLLVNYDDLLLHNSTAYFDMFDTDKFIDQSWHCDKWTNPQVNPDGSLMACVDKPLTKPLTIFDLPEKEEEVEKSFYEAIEGCTGCFWDHEFDTHHYAEKETPQKGKEKFAHEGD